MQSGTLLLSEDRSLPGYHTTTVYRYAVRTGAIETVHMAAIALGLDVDEVNEAIAHLVESRLLREETTDRRRLVPVDPEVAAALLVSPMEREIYQRREIIARIRQRTEVFREDYARTSRLGVDTGSIDRVVGATEVFGYLKVAGDACHGEVMMLLSGEQDNAEFDDFRQICALMLERRLTVRIICRHRSRADLAVRTKIKSLTDAGALVRTVSHIPRAAVIFDRQLALLLGTSDEGEMTASQVRNGEIVTFLMDMFSHLWDTATPLDRFDSGYAEVSDDLRTTIAGMMAKGFTDEVLARKLGMSVRTCRRHIAALMRELNAASRFQAGVKAAHSGLVDG